MSIFLEHIDSLDIFEWIRDHGPIMNDKQFTLAIKGLRIRAKAKDVAYRVLVNGESRTDVIADSGMQKAAVSQLISKVMKNFDVQLKKHGLVYQPYVLPENIKSLVDVVEDEHLQQYIQEPGKMKRHKKNK